MLASPMPYALCPMPYAHQYLQKSEKGYMFELPDLFKVFFLLLTSADMTAIRLRSSK